MFKKILTIALLLALAPLAYAEPEGKSSVWVFPSALMAGDFTTSLAVTDPGDNTLPWIAKDLSVTVAVVGDVIDNTATAVTGQFVVPNNYRNSGMLYAIVKAAADDSTAKFTVTAQNLGTYSASPTTTTAVTVGTSSAALTTAGLDNLTRLRLPNSAIESAKKNQRISFYLARTAGTGENVYIHALVYEYTPEYFGHR